MSYDIEVYSAAEPAGDLIATTIRDRGDGLPSMVSVEAPFAIPGSEGPTVFARREVIWLTRFLVPYGAPPDSFEVARYVAADVASRCEGVVVDPQSVEVAPFVRGERGNVVKLEWFMAPEGWGSACTAFLKSAATEWSDATPRLYGETEPLKHRYADDPAGFCEAWMTGSPIHWKASSPVYGGSAQLAPANPPEGFVRCGRIEIAALADDLNAEQLRRFLIALALELKAFYAAAAVETDVVLSSRGYGYDRLSRPVVLSRRWWGGVPATPTWMAWFGPSYARLLDDLNKQRPDVEPVADGLFVMGSSVPLSPGRLHQQGLSALPSDLLWLDLPPGTGSRWGRPARHIPLPR